MSPSQRPALSVAMTTYQAAGFLGPQLESIRSQTVLPDELVVFDDGSTDGTWDELSDFATHAPFACRLSRQPQNVGLLRNMQDTLAACTGEVIVLADQDDLWEPEKLATVARTFEDAEVTLWFSDADLIDGAGRSLNRRSWDAVGLSATVAQHLDSTAGLRRLLHGMTVTGATMAFRRDILALALPLPADLEGEDHLFLHDGWLAVVAAVHGRVVADPRPLTRYRQHPGQLTGMSMAGPSRAAAAPKLSQQRNRRSRDSRRRDLRRDQARVALVARRLAQAAPGRPVVARKAAYLQDLQCFLDVRTLPRGASRRRLQVARQLLTGGYNRHARGIRTALLDLR